MDRKSYVIAYDVACPKRRQKILRTLSAWRYAGQKSVALCWMSPAEFEQTWQTLLAIFDEKEDALLSIAQDGRSPSLGLGLGQPSSTPNWIVG